MKGAARALRTFVQATDKKVSDAGAAGARAMETAESAHPFGPFAETLRRAAALGERELWAVHATLADSPEYRAAMARAGLDFSQGAESAGKAKAETLGTLEKASQSFDARAEASAQNFVEGRRSSRKPTAPTAETRKAAEDAQQLAQRPDIVTERVTQSLSKVGRWAPGTFAAAVSTAQRGVAYLAQTAPKPPPRQVAWTCRPCAGHGRPPGRSCPPSPAGWRR